MLLRYKFVLPVNLILVVTFLASLGLEWRRQGAMGIALLRSRIDEETRFIHAAHRTFGVTPNFQNFLVEFCHGIDPNASPEHQVALLDRNGNVLAEAAEHSRYPIDLRNFADAIDGFSQREHQGETFLIRISSADGNRAIVAESTRQVKDLVWTNLRIQAGWFISAGLLVFSAVNLIMRRAVLRPIRRISQAVQLLKHGQLGVEVASPNGDELGALALQFNSMSRSLAEQAESERLEMETARRVQAHLLPPQELRVGCLHAVGRCIPLCPVGGDLYDVQLLSKDRVGILLVDMCGHNVAAALHTAMVRSIVWREAQDASGPGEVLTRLNMRLCQDLPDGHFATVFFGWFEPMTNILRYANAGHPSPILQDIAGRCQELEPTMPLLGIFPDMLAEDATRDVDSGSRLLVFSDGLIEVTNALGKIWGTSELLMNLEADPHAELNGLLSRILDRRLEVRVEGSPEDDVTVVLVEYKPTMSSRSQGIKLVAEEVE